MGIKNMLPSAIEHMICLGLHTGVPLDWETIRFDSLPVSGCTKLSFLLCNVQSVGLYMEFVGWLFCFLD